MGKIPQDTIDGVSGDVLSTARHQASKVKPCQLRVAGRLNRLRVFADVFDEMTTIADKMGFSDAVSKLQGLTMNVASVWEQHETTDESEEKHR